MIKTVFLKKLYAVFEIVSCLEYPHIQDDFNIKLALLIEQNMHSRMKGLVKWG
jgi:hypothetical protein